MNRVVITGIGAVTPIGNDLESIENAFYTGKSGIEWVDEFNTVHGTVKLDLSQWFDNVDYRSTDRFTRMAWVAYTKAKHDAQNMIPESVFAGLGFGGGAVALEEFYNNSLVHKKKNNPLLLMRAIPSSAVSFITMKEGIKGPSMTYTTACSSSTVALGEAFLKIMYGEISSAAVLGYESVNTNFNASSWRAIGAIAEDKQSPENCVRPYSKDRKGTAIGEGAICFIVESLESAISRQAKIYGEVVGYSCRSGTETYTKPSKEAQIDVIKRACKSLDLNDITYINAHGTGTVVGDLIELESIKEVFKDNFKNIPISSTKSLTGHLLGGAGAIETLACLVVLKNDKVIPNHFLKEKDESIDAETFLPIEPVTKEMNVVLNNSFAFGGTNAVIALKKWK
jgi:3-oxoacyl-[acyl-carrier-protein] synthase II